MIRPLPDHIKRTYVKTEGGDLELLICEPKTNQSHTTSSHPPIFFAHGGCGSAGVWLEWMTYLHEHNYSGTLYAYSLRTHGASYTLPYWRMVNRTSFEHLQSDFMACLNEANQREQKQDPKVRLPILVGHSSGGGLVQSLLCSKSPNTSLRTKASGLCLVGAIPSYGSYDLYWNWLKQDPWFPIRSNFHLQHPNSPLSNDQLVHRAFFGHKFPLSQTWSFRKWMPAYESMGWPTAMVGNSFLAWASGQGNTWLSAKDIYANIQNAGDGSDKVCVLIGKEDMMFRPTVWVRQCKEYREALQELKSDRKVEELKEPVSIRSDKPIDAVTVNANDGTRLVLVEDSGHHVQNDVHNEQAAEAFMQWANQV